MASPSWTQVADDFQNDGSLRDIRVVGAGSETWPAVYSLITAWEPPPIFTVGGRVTPLPASAEAVFDMTAAASTMLAFNVGKARMICHIFGVEDFEFDLNPLEVTGQHALTALTDFMRKLMCATDRTVILTGESRPDAVILKVEPGDTEAAWVPPPSEL